MPAYTCPQCQKPFDMPASTSAAQVACPHCRQTVALPKTSASRWFFTPAKNKYGPYTWQQLLSLAQCGDLHPTDMLLQEGAKQWVRADTLPALFAKGTASAPPAAARKQDRRSFPWLLAGLAGCGASTLLAVCFVVGVFFGQIGRASCRERV